MTTERKQCSVKVYPREPWGAFHPQSCSKPAIIERDGKWYCRIHDPQYIKAKNQKWQEKFDKEWAAKQLVWDRNTAMKTATEGLTIEELKALTPALLRAAIPMRDALEAFDEYISTNYPANIRLKQIAIERMEIALSQAKEGKE